MIHKTIYEVASVLNSSSSIFFGDEKSALAYVRALNQGATTQPVIMPRHLFFMTDDELSLLPK